MDYCAMITEPIVRAWWQNQLEIIKCNSVYENLSEEDISIRDYVLNKIYIYKDRNQYLAEEYLRICLTFPKFQNVFEIEIE